MAGTFHIKVLFFKYMNSLSKEKAIAKLSSFHDRK